MKRFSGVHGCFTRSQMHRHVPGVAHRQSAAASARGQRRRALEHAGKILQGS
jgi:hypothetical protein